MLKTTRAMRVMHSWMGIHLKNVFRIDVWHGRQCNDMAHQVPCCAYERRSGVHAWVGNQTLTYAACYDIGMRHCVLW